MRVRRFFKIYRRWLPMLLAVGAVGVLALFIYGYRQAPDYTIPGVVPLTHFSDGAFGSFLIRPDVAAVASVLRYWGYTVDPYDREQLKELAAVFSVRARVRALQRYLDPLGFTVRAETLASPAALKQYINAEMRTPLIVGARVLPAVQGDVAHRVVIGVDERRRMLTMHDFIFGNNIEVSFDEYESWWSGYNAARKYRYLVIQPKNFSASLRALSDYPAPYPKRPVFLNALRPLLTQYYQGARLSADNPEASDRLLGALTRNILFNELHPYIRTSAYAFRARAAMRLGRLDDAEVYLDRAFVHNQNLDLPFGDWPRVLTPTLPFVERVASEYYAVHGEGELAQSHRRAYDEQLTALVAKKKDTAPLP